MEVREIVSEAPVSGIKQTAQSVGSAVAGKVPGMKNIAANLGGKADLSKIANDYYTQFNRYLGTQGKSIRQATGDDLAEFFRSKGIKLGISIPSGVLQKNQINNVMIAAAKKNPDAAEKPVSNAPKKKPTGKTSKNKVPQGFKKKLDTLSDQQKRKLASLL